MTGTVTRVPESTVAPGEQWGPQSSGELGPAQGPEAGGRNLSGRGGWFFQEENSLNIRDTCWGWGVSPGHQDCACLQRTKVHLMAVSKVKRPCPKRLWPETQTPS